MASFTCSMRRESYVDRLHQARVVEFDHGHLLRAIGADITTLNVEAIVNAANESLPTSGGACEVHSSHCEARIGTGMSYARRMPNRRCEATKGYHLPAQYVIHVVESACGVEMTANWSSSFSAIAVELIADASGIATRALPSISPSIYGYPLKLAAMAEVPTIREVTFCCYSTGGLAVYQQLPI